MAILRSSTPAIMKFVSLYTLKWSVCATVGPIPHHMFLPMINIDIFSEESVSPAHP